MLEVFLIHDQHLQQRLIEEPVREGEFWLQEEAGKLRLHKGSRSLLISSMATVEDFTLITAPFHGYLAYELPARLVFGRSLLKKDAPVISKTHFILEKGKIQDLSRNGTWLNGSLIHQADVSYGSHIAAGMISLYVLPPLLLSSQPLNLEPFQNRPVTLWQPIRFEGELPGPVQGELELQSAHAQGSYEAPSLFSSIGSSLMIAASTGLSAGISALLWPERTESMFSMLLTSSSMAIAFLCYGLLNRQLEIRKQEKQLHAGAGDYEAYLKGVLESAEAMKKAAQEKAWDVLQAFDQLNDLGQPQRGLPLGLHQQAGLQVKLPAVSYDQQQASWHQNMLKTAREMEKPARQLFLAQPGMRLYVPQLQQPEQVEALFWHWLAWRTSPKARFYYFSSQALPERLAENPLIITSRRLFQPALQSLILTEYALCALDPQDLESAICLTWQKGVLEQADCLDYMELSSCSLRQQRSLMIQAMNRPSAWQQIIQASDFSQLDLWQLRQSTPLLGGFMQDEAGDLFKLDLHEKAMGPHALIAGMTGSGKSELIRSLLIQMCLFQDPARFQFMIIDFKGSALGQLFYELPHFAGKVDNLSLYEMHRFEQAMRHELEERQKKLAWLVSQHPEADASADDYNRYYPSQPMSHLLIVVDEFAEVKQALPESMAFIKELARIGRSLGIHLLLATQRPSGIIDEQIWANSNLKMCLKVAQVQDSREVLGFGDAGSIKEPGCGYFITSEMDQPAYFASLYTRQPICEQRILLEKEKPQYHSVLEELRQAIRSLAQPSHLILRSFSLALAQNCLVMVDLAWKQKLKRLPVQPLVLLDRTPKALEEALEHQPASWLTNREGSLHYLPKEREYELSLAQSPLIYVLSLKVRSDLEKIPYLTRCPLILILVSERAEWLFGQPGLLMASVKMPRQELQAFFGRSCPLKPEQGYLALVEDHVSQACFGRWDQTSAPYTPGPLPNLCLGRQENSLIVHDPRQPLHIYYESRPDQQLLEQCLSIWQERSPQTPFQVHEKDSQMAKQPFVYIGQQYLDFAQRHKAPAFYGAAGQGIYVSQGQPQMVERWICCF